MSGQGGAGRREVAWRVFASEFDDATLEHSDSDEERAPNYVVTPTGARINRLFVVGVLTEIEEVSDGVLRGRVVDPTGGFVVYAGQYQPDAMAFLERADPPAFVAVTGKARTFSPDDSDAVYTSIRPESVNVVDAETRDRWTVQTAEQTMDRVEVAAAALDSGEYGDDLRRALEASDVDNGLAAGVPLALDHYATTKTYLAAVRDSALDAARVVAGERDEVEVRNVAPDEQGEAAGDFGATLGDLEVDTDAVSAGESDAERPAGDAPAGGSAAEPSAESSAGDTSAGSLASDADAESSTGDISAEDATTDTTAEGATTESASDDAEAITSEPDPEPTETAESGSTAGTTETAETTETTADAADSGPETEATSAAREPERGDETTKVDANADAGDDLGDFDSGESDDLGDFDADDSGTSEDDLGDFDSDESEPADAADVGDEMYEFDEGERERIEEEFGTEFSTGAEVGSPGEADIETPEPEASSETTESESTESEPAESVPTEPETETESGSETVETEPESETVEAESEAEPDGASEGASASESEPEPEPETESDDDAAGSVPENLENTVMETMQDLNGDGGVERERLLAAVVDSYDVTPAEVEEALQDALMAGRCYEAGEDSLKPI